MLSTRCTLLRAPRTHACCTDVARHRVSTRGVTVTAARPWASVTSRRASFHAPLVAIAAEEVHRPGHRLAVAGQPPHPHLDRLLVLDRARAGHRELAPLLLQVDLDRAGPGRLGGDPPRRVPRTEDVVTGPLPQLGRHRGSPFASVVLDRRSASTTPPHPALDEHRLPRTRASPVVGELHPQWCRSARRTPRSGQGQLGRRRRGRVRGRRPAPPPAVRRGSRSTDGARDDAWAALCLLRPRVPRRGSRRGPSRAPAYRSTIRSRWMA